MNNMKTKIVIFYNSKPFSRRESEKNDTSSSIYSGVPTIALLAQKGLESNCHTMRREGYTRIQYISRVILYHEITLTQPSDLGMAILA